MTARCPACRHWDAARGGRAATCPLAGMVPPAWIGGCSWHVLRIATEDAPWSGASEPAAGGLPDGAARKPAQTSGIVERRKARKGPNRTETRARALLALLADAAPRLVHEGQEFEVAGGARYTPDWTDSVAGVAIECKAEYVRSRDSERRFAEARDRYPDWTWAWLRHRTTGRKGRRWEMTVWEAIRP